MGGAKAIMKSGIKKVYEIMPWGIKSAIRELLPSLFVPSLYKSLPLGVPQSLHIDIGNLCNFKCTFCPTGDSSLLANVNRPKGMMPYELFKKIIDDLKEMCISTGGMVEEMHLYKDGEPMLHKELGKIIAYAKESNTARSVETTTNGSLLSKEKAMEIIEAGLDVLRVSVEHVSSEGYKKITQNYSDYEKIKENVKFLFEEKERRNSPLIIKVKIVDVNLTRAEIEKFKEDFTPISDIININQLMGWSNSRLKDFTLGIKVKRAMGGVALLNEKQICPEPFRSMAINFNGQVSVCCVDWSFGTLVGDVTGVHLRDIWNGAEMTRFRKKHLEKRRNEIEACSDCHYLKGFADHLVLDGREEMLKSKYGI